MHLITGRGCPNNCAFCYEGANAKVVRYRSIENVFEEINHIIYENPQTNFLRIVDDTFTLDAKRVIRFCEEMRKIRENHNISWFCEAHVNNLCQNPEVISIMVDAGLVFSQIGIESGSQKVLNAYNKNITPQMVFDVVKRFNEAKLSILTGNIIVGGAWETWETVEETIEMAKNLICEGKGMLELNTSYFWPFPNTPISRCPGRYGVNIQTEQLEKSVTTFCNCVINTQSLSREDIIEAKRKLDGAMALEYKKFCLELDKKTLYKFWNPQNSQFYRRTHWGRHAFSYEYIRKYFATVTNVNYNFDIRTQFEKIYPVRTFELLEYIDNRLCVYGISFDNVQSKILEYSNGRNTVVQISQKIGIEIDVVIRICIELENKCFMYYSYF